MDSSLNSSTETSEKKNSKAKAKLSLSLDKPKNRLKESNGQASIISFFQRKTSENFDAEVITSEDETEQKKKKIKKRKKRKKVDNNVESSVKTQEMNNLSDELIEISQPVNKQTSDLDNSEKPITKINAFTFMMDSRYKSIGQNSPGKEVEKIEESPEIKSENKKKLLSRKAMFEEWAERKGSGKRKIEDVEKGLIIEDKLKKRAKRLKKMLNIDPNAITMDHSVDEDMNSKVNGKLKSKKLITSLNKHKDESHKENGIYSEPQSEVLIKESGPLTTQSLQKWKMKLKVCFEVEDNQEQKKKSKPKITNEKEEAVLVDSNQVNCDEKKDSVDQEIGGKHKTKVIVSSSDLEVEVLPVQKEKTQMETKPNGNGDVKLAPLFVLAKGKTKLDKAVVAARKQFLHSALPESVKKVIEKTQRLDTPDYEVFPTVSHVRTILDSELSNIQPIVLNLTPVEKDIPKIGKLTKGCITNLNVISESIEFKIPEKIKSFRHIVKDLKHENPDYPIYKTFKSLYKKSNVETEIPTPVPQTVKKKKRGRPKKKSAHDEVQKNDVPKSIQFQIWTDLYRPKTSKEIFGNQFAVSKLRTWLESWMELNLSACVPKRRSSNSSSDFDYGEENSKDKSSTLENTLVLVGPHGSGKTTAIYAVCNDLHINVLEINASSKRTGKRLLLELQEATQSYQVKKKATSDLSSFIANETEPSNKTVGKMCLLLIEDVDLVYEQDDGFISALSQLVTSSKRPIVLTTTNNNCLYLQKFANQFTVITFSPLSLQCLAPWLQILCLVEGLLVSRDTVAVLLEYNKGDVRKTLLQLQFWVQSGGQLQLLKSECKTNLSNLDVQETICEDDNSNLSWLKDDEENLNNQKILHKNYIDLFQSPLPNLGFIWWNTHLILNMPPPTRKSERQSTNKPLDSQLNDFKAIYNFFETLVMTDLVYRKFCIIDDAQPVHKNMNKTIVDSLELSESEECYTSKDVCCEWTNMLCKGNLDILGNKELSQVYFFGTENRWQSKLSSCKDYFIKAVPQVNQFQRNAVNLDYFPTLRTISRSETLRASNISKRRSRFYNYLQGLGVYCNENYFQMMSDVFYIEK